MIRLLLAYTDTEFEDKKYNLKHVKDNEYDASEWTEEKFSLGLPFPNVNYPLKISVFDHKKMNLSLVVALLHRRWCEAVADVRHFEIFRWKTWSLTSRPTRENESRPDRRRGPWSTFKMVQSVLPDLWRWGFCNSVEPLLYRRLTYSNCRLAIGKTQAGLFSCLFT